MRHLIFSIFLLNAVYQIHAQENISLILPLDGDTIETKNPLLTWTYLGSFETNNDRAYYRIIIVELEDQQSAEAGIIVNQPLVKMDQLKGTQLFYPYDAPELEDGHRYGWQIQKVSNNVIIDKSEAWEFILPLPIIPKPNYYQMKIKNDGVVYEVIDGKIYLHFVENYYDSNLSFYLYDHRNKLMNVDITIDPGAKEETREINVEKTGSNFYELDLGNYAQPGIYRLLILDGKNQKYEMKYQIK